MPNNTQTPSKKSPAELARLWGKELDRTGELFMKPLLRELPERFSVTNMAAE